MSAINLQGFKNVGSVSSSFPVMLSVAVPLNNLSLLQSMEEAISNPASPQYRQFLSQQTIQQLFLPVAQYESTLNFLTANGFNIVTTAEDSIIIATGTAGQLQSSLGLSVLLYTNGTETYYAASGSPTLPGVYVYSSNATSVLTRSPAIPSTRILDARRTSQSVPNVTTPIETYQAADLRLAYNASQLVSSGYNGKGKGIGIYEAGGDPNIAQELAAFDQETGLPAPPSFSIVPIGPYNPNAGVLYGIPYEEALDVQSSHAMAPGANITVYTENLALPLAPAIAVIDQQDTVNVLTTSYGYDENYYPYFGASFFVFGVTLADQYFLLGSAEGITFMNSSGDAGGSGYAAQPVGTMSYPATSPYVVSTGGTTTFLTFSHGNVISSYQTAWSNEGFENPLGNFGGGTGGVSAIEPKPWYQSSIATPSSYENGRLQPDISLNANIDPAILEVVDGNDFSPPIAGFVNSPVGGTSESAPLLAGLLADVDQKIGGSLGLINPVMYQMGESSSLYKKEFIPITFGYITPWVSSYGYNLATGWGAPNIGEWADYFASISPGSSPGIQVTITNSKGKSQFEFPAGTRIDVSAVPSLPISNPTKQMFTADLVTLQGAVATVSLNYDATTNSWNGVIKVPQSASGISNINVKGKVEGATAHGFAQIFTGYLATIDTPFALGTISWSTMLGLNISMQITNLNGKAVTNGSFGYTASTYSLSENKYLKFTSGAFAYSEGVWNSSISGNYPLGATLIILNGVYGFDPFINGVSLATSFIIPPTNSEPGVVSPGQYLEIGGELQAPTNTPNIIGSELGIPIAQEIEIESNVTASLISPSGHVVSSIDVGLLATSSTIMGLPINYLGYLEVPSNSGPGLYDITLQSSYQSIDLNGIFINGSYFGQVLVSGQPAIVPKITLSPNPVSEGSTVQIKANIAFANGTEVKYGMFSATLYPAFDSQNYAKYSALPAGQIPLWYDPSLNLWVGNVTLPSDTSLGWIGGYTSFLRGAYPGIVTQPVSGPWDAYVSGLSANGVGTTTNQNAQQSFTVSP